MNRSSILVWVLQLKLLITMCLLTNVNASHPIRLVCRYNNQKVPNSHFTVDKINPYLCTHILWRTGYLLNPTTGTESGLVKFFEGYSTFMRQVKKNPELKVMLSVEARTFRDIRDELLPESSTCRKVTMDDLRMLADTVVELVKDNQFVGLDFDWGHWFHLLYDIDFIDALKKIQEGLKRNGLLFSITISKPAVIGMDILDNLPLCW